MQSMDALDRSLNSLLLQAAHDQPVEIEEEIISLKPIGPGVQNLEPSSNAPKMSPVASAFPIDGQWSTNNLKVKANFLCLA